MRIRNKLNFRVGVICAICCLISVGLGRDMFVIILTGILAIFNLSVGLTYEDK